MRIGWVSFVVLVFAACGGSIETTPGGASSSSSGASGSSGSSSGSSSGGSSGVVCSKTIVNGSRACVPGTAPDGAPITLEVDATEGCLSCFTNLDECKVTVDGLKITLTMEATQCPRPEPCPPVCMVPEATCTLPPLTSGTYTIEVTGEDRRGLPPRELVVVSGAKDTSCTLPPPGGTPDPLDGTKYSRSCVTAEDCVTATTGNLCQPCKCPDTAIAKSAAEEYEADHRARLSQCPNPGGVACAACPPTKAECEAGTCKLVPGF